MNERKACFVLGIVIGVAALCGPALAQGDESQDAQMAAMMEAMAKAAAPGPQHELLKQLEGVWNAQVRVNMGPEPIEGRGVAQNEMILGGRFLKSMYKGEMMGEAFLGMGLDGYDTHKQKYIGMWVDTLGTMMTTFEGEADESGKTRTMYGEYVDPLTGAKKSFKGIVTIVSTNRYTYESWEKSGDGEFERTMQIIFSKK